MTADNDIQKLIRLLDKAEQLARQFSGGYSGQFLSAQEFHKSLVDSITRLKQGDNSQLRQMYIWFLPTSCWDDFVREGGIELGQEISDLLSVLPKNIKA